jgi:cbb3-type cytochrome oxidase maturation protein
VLINNWAPKSETLHTNPPMDILFVLIPLSVALALLILGALGWAVWRGQFEGVDAEAERILRSD